MRTWSKSGVEVRELGSAVVVLFEGSSLLVDCGDGLGRMWASQNLPEAGPEAIAFTSGRARRVAGIYAFLAQIMGKRKQSLRLLHGMDNEPLAHLLGAWSTSVGSTHAPAVEMEADLPGALLSAGPFALVSHALDKPQGGLAWRVEVGGVVVAVGGEAVACQGLERACAGANLAVINGDHHSLDNDTEIWSCAPWG